MTQPDAFDFLCVGSGPAGQKAAIQAAKAGFRAAIIEREPQVGGSCLLSGTIPSKALREQALRYRRMQGSASSLAVELRGDAPLSALLHGVDAVIDAQDRYLQAQLARNQVELIRGRGSVPGREPRRGAAPGRLADRGARAAHAARHRLAAAACGRHRSGSRTHPRQRFDPEPAVHAAIDGGAGQRRDRLRVRVDLRRAGLRRDPARQGGGAAGISRSRAARRISRRLPGRWAAAIGAAPSCRRALRRLLAGGGAAQGRRGRWPPTSCSRRSAASPTSTASVSTG